MIWRWLKRILAVLLIIVLGLLAPVGYNELACTAPVVANDYQPILPTEDHRPEARTLLTYPEWHIVHAYDDYAKVIESGSPHEFGYLRAISGFWSALCPLSERAAMHGGFDDGTKLMVYTIGVSFTAELMAKAAYEETIGRLVYLASGRSELDDVSARQARSYADFLQQVPWHQWDFSADRAELITAAADGLRNAERRIALGLEYSAKAAYAKVIANAVANIGADETRLRMVVTDVPEATIRAIDKVEYIGTNDGNMIIETPRYRALTGILVEMANLGIKFVEIAGNDDILLTSLSGAPDKQAFFSFPRQSYGDYRNLILLKVSALSAYLRETGATVEHIHDY